MKSRLQRFSELIEPITPEEAAAIDARASERAAAGATGAIAERTTREIEPGLNWVYLSQVAANNPRGFDAETESAAAKEKPESVEIAALQRKKWQWNANTVFAIAASLLVGAMLGIFANRDNGSSGTQVALADVSLTTRGNARAGNEAKDYFLEVTQPFDGYISWVLLVPGEAPEVFPTLGGEIHRVATGKREAIGPIPPAAEVIVAITEQPANDFLRQQVDAAEFRKGEAATIKERLVQTLSNANYKRISTAVQNVPAEPAK